METPLKTATITVDEKEAQNLIQLIDIACKAAGLSVAGVAAGWHAKLHLAFNPKVDSGQVINGNVSLAEPNPSSEVTVK